MEHVTTEATYHLGRSTPSDTDFILEKHERAPKHRFSDAAARSILSMVDTNKTTKTIQAKYPKYRPSRIGELRSQLGVTSRMTQFERIDAHVMERVSDARRNLNVVRGWMLQTWGMEYARSIGAVNFKAKLSWLNLFKKRHRIVGRAITKRTSRAKEANKDKIVSTKNAFIDYF